MIPRLRFLPPAIVSLCLLAAPLSGAPAAAGNDCPLADEAERAERLRSSAADRRLSPDRRLNDLFLLDGISACIPRDGEAAFLRRITADPGSPVRLRLTAGGMLHRLERERGRRTGPPPGFLTGWRIAVDPPSGDAPLDPCPDGRRDGAVCLVGWPREFSTDGSVDPGTVVQAGRDRTVRAVGRFRLPAPVTVVLSLGLSSPAEVTVDGQVVFSSGEPWRYTPHQVGVRLDLGPGLHRIAIGMKVGETGSRFSAGLWKVTGDPLAFEEKDGGPDGRLRTFAVAWPDRSSPAPDSPEARIEQALLRLHAGDHPPGGRSVDDLLPADIELTTDPWLLDRASRAVQDRDRLRGMLERLVSFSAMAAGAAGRLADLRRLRGDLRGAVALIDRIPDCDRSFACRRASLACDEELYGSAAVVGRWKGLHAACGDAPEIVDGLAGALRRADLPRERQALLVLAAAGRPGRAEWLGQIVPTVRAGGGPAQAIALAVRLVAAEPGVPAHRLALARLMREAGRTAAAAAEIETVVRLFAGRAEALEAAGRLLIGWGERRSGLPLLERALGLKPQNPELRRYLEFAAGGLDSERLLLFPSLGELRSLASAMPAPDPLWPLRVVQQTIVTEVYPGGLRRTAQQFAVRIDSRSGAEMIRGFSVGHYPGYQQVRIVSALLVRPDGSVLRQPAIFDTEPGRPGVIYYDSRERHVQFPEAAPGDLFAIEYEIDDTGGDNLFPGYFGEVVQIGRTVPVERFRYVLRVRGGLPIGHAVTGPWAGAPVEPRRHREGEVEVYQWDFSRIPAVGPEPHMVPLAGLTPHLTLSSFASWRDLGRWYFGLAASSMAPGERLRDKVRTLITGAAGPEEVVGRLYDFVQHDIRYLGLEFGVHSYKPYPVELVLERRHGDCKDKAALLVAMLAEAGIEASLVAVRTADRGRLEGAAPSLALFNHALVYLPGLDLYLDGTTRYRGIRDLPGFDQGAMVFHPSLAGGRLAETPRLPAGVATVALQLSVRPEAGGVCLLEGELAAAGEPAASVSRLLLESAEPERGVERLLAGMFPGIRLTRHAALRPAPPWSRAGVDFSAVLPACHAAVEGRMRLGELFESLPEGGELAALSGRSTPLDLGPAAEWQTEVTVYAPAGFTACSSPFDRQSVDPAGGWSARLSLEGADLKLTLAVRNAGGEVLPADYRAFRESRGGLARLLGDGACFERR